MKGRNCRDLIYAKEIKKRWKEYMEELYKKDINKPDNYDGVAGHPEPDILKCKVKWAFRSTAVNKASGCDGIPIELFKTLMDEGIAFNMSANLEHPAVATGLEKVNPQPNSQDGW